MDTNDMDKIVEDEIQEMEDRELEEQDELINKVIECKDNISIFQGMSEGEVAMVVRNVEISLYSKGEAIIKQGDMNNEVFFLLSGECQVFVDKIQVGTIKENHAFGEFSHIVKGPRNATIVASDSCVVISFDIAFEVIEAQMSGFAMLYRNIAKELIKKVDYANEKCKNINQ